MDVVKMTALNINIKVSNVNKKFTLNNIRRLFQPYWKTRRHLFAELKRIADAVKEYGGAWYVDNGDFHKDASVLYVSHSGCIGVTGLSGIHSVNEIKISKKDGKPIITGWAIDVVSHMGDQENLLTPGRRMFAGYMVYDIYTGDYVIRDEREMLETYQKTLRDEEGIAPIAATNSMSRIGGVYYGMSFDQIMEKMKTMRKDRRIRRAATAG